MAANSKTTTTSSSSSAEHRSTPTKATSSSSIEKKKPVAGFVTATGRDGHFFQRQPLPKADMGGAVKPIRRDQYLEEEDINEVADAFIKRFREQLHLQRLNSIENYNQMLARGL